jgi:hypothetical protein
MPRLAVLRLCNLTKMVVKEPNEPCVFVAHLAETPSDAQLRRLVAASPWSPVMIEAMLGPWDAATKAFEAEIQTIDSMPKHPLPAKPRRKCQARKQHNRMVEM